MGDQFEATRFGWQSFEWERSVRIGTESVPWTNTKFRRYDAVDSTVHGIEQFRWAVPYERHEINEPSRNQFEFQPSNGDVAIGIEQTDETRENYFNPSQLARNDTD